MTEPSSDRHGTSPPWPPSDPAIQKVFEGMLEDGSWGRYHGPHCAHLRQKLADLHQSEFVTLCSSGTSAVELALRAAGVSDGDEAQWQQLWQRVLGGRIGKQCHYMVWNKFYQGACRAAAWT